MDEWGYRAAGDDGMAGRERRRSSRRETGLLGALLALPWWCLVRIYLKAWHGFRVEGRELLPGEARFLLVGNHSSHLDALALTAAMPLRWNGHVFPVAAGDVFFDAPLAAFAAGTFLNALPLWRRKGAAHTLRDLRERLAAGGMVAVLFPEGTRSRGGEMGVFKPGFVKIVAGTDVPVVPCFLEGAWEALPPGARWPRRRKVVLRVGRALDASGVLEGKDALVEFALKVRGAVEELRD